MNILVTGAAGFVGSHVVDALLAAGNKVIAVDNLNDYYNPDFKEGNISGHLGNANYSIEKIDIRDKEAVDSVFAKHKIDKIIHLAARAGVRPSIEDPLIYEQTNVLGTMHLLNAAKENKIQQFVFGSSSSIYGNSKETPFSEDMKTDKPISPYAATKKAAELICHTYSHLYKLPITCLRLFTVYGPRGRPDMAPYKFTKAISEGTEITMFGDGSSQRDYTFVKDIVSGILKALEKPFPFEIINLGNSKPVELKKFISVIEESVRKKANIKQIEMQPGDVDITYANIDKAKKLLGWEPTTSIEEGMKEFVAWYKNERA